MMFACSIVLRRLVAGILVAGTAVAVPATAAPRVARLPADFEEVEGIAAIVGTTLITFGELRRAMGSQQATQEVVPTDIARPRSLGELRLQVLQSLIDNALVLRAASELGVTVEDRDVDQQIAEVKKRNTWDDDELATAVRKLGFATVAAYRLHVRQELTRVRMLQIKLGSRLRVADDEVKKMLELEHCGGTCEEEVHARHIMVGVRGDDTPVAVNKKRDKAWQIHDLLVAGKASFEDLADKFNDDRGAPDGDLGWQRRWTIEPGLAAKLWSLKKNEYSAVVQTPYGFHVLQLLDRRRTQAKDKELLEEFVRRRLQEDQLARLYKAWIEELRRTTHIEARVQ
ncbi:MAG: peptidylprolyl isomerase [Deltaproteobacteria bacterium]|nr:peptidylprolyl isomerase [Deltaproteobacteria bacterium]